MNEATTPVGPGHNRPPAPVDLARERVDELIANANAWAQRYSKIEDEETAASAAGFLDQLLKHRQQFQAARDDERRPFGEKYDAVNAKWGPLLDRITACEKIIDLLHRSWLRLGQQRLNEQRRKERHMAELTFQIAEEAHKAALAAQGTPQALNKWITAHEAAAEAEEARQALAAIPERAQVRSHFGGRARSLRYVWRASINDYDAAYAHFREHIAVQQLLLDLTNQAVRAKDGPRPADGQDRGTSDKLPFAVIYRDEA